jgi:hypothetical protein
MSEVATLTVGMLAGAVTLALAFGIFLLAQKAWSAAKDLTAALRGIPQLVKSNQEVAKALHRFSGELEFLRTVMTGGTPPEGAQAQTGAPADPQRPPAGAAAQFPQWQPFVAVVDAPDAEESDTEIIDTPDEELAEIEGIEEIRGRGYAAGPEADPMENPPGVVANV